MIQAVADENGLHPATFVVSLEQTSIRSTSSDTKFNLLQGIRCLGKKHVNDGRELITTPLLLGTESIQVTFKILLNFILFSNSLRYALANIYITL